MFRPRVRILKQILGIIVAGIGIREGQDHIPVNPGQVGYKWSIVKIEAVARGQRRTGEKREEEAGSGLDEGRGVRDTSRAPSRWAKKDTGQAATTAFGRGGRNCFGSRRTINYTKSRKVSKWFREEIPLLYKKKKKKNKYIVRWTPFLRKEIFVSRGNFARDRAVCSLVSTDEFYTIDLMETHMKNLLHSWSWSLISRLKKFFSSFCIAFLLVAKVKFSTEEP